MNSQQYGESSEDNVTPPIFTPSHTSNTDSNSTPPSFIPQRSNTAKQHRSAEQSAPSFAPQQRPSQNARVYNSTSSYASRPATYLPSHQPAAQPTPLRKVRQYIPDRAITSSAATAPAVANALLPRKKHRLLHAFLALVAMFAIGCVGLGAYSWHWVDSHMNRTSWLTNTPNTQGTSWLILGSDQREGEEAKEITGFRTDTILVLTRPSNGNSSLISIPRDSLVTINGEHMKINSVAQTTGNKTLTSVVERITGHRIDHVAEVRFAGLTNVVNALDGIDLCYNRTVSDRFSGLNWTAGCHHVDGNTALAFSRMRYADPQSDFGRAARQRMVIAAIMKKALDKSTLTNFGKVKKLAETGLSSVQFDEKSNPGTLWNMAQAFKEATGPKGISGTVYWTNPDYQLPDVGSSVLLDDAKNLELFNELATGSHAPGAVGTLADMQQ